jgi:hypothetical protein
MVQPVKIHLIHFPEYTLHKNPITGARKQGNALLPSSFSAIPGKILAISLALAI